MEIDKKTILWVVIGILMISLLFLMYKQSISTGSLVSGKVDTTGWTENEIMNYEMHGTIPARISSSASTLSSGMVGGC